MFEWMNRHKKDIMTYTLWLVIPSFIVLYGYGECQKPQRVRWVAKVNGDSIGEIEWMQLIDNIQSQMQRYGQDIDREEVRGQALDTSISMALNRGKAEAYGLQTLNEEVSQSIREMQYFKDQQGNFNINIYRGLLQRVGKHPIQFEEEQRDNLTMSKLRTLVSNSLFPAENEVKRIEQREAQKVQVDYLAFEPNRYVDDVEPDAEGLKAFFEKNKEDYRIADQRRIAYAKFKPAQYISEATFSEYQLNRFFDENREQYRIQDSVRVEYITYKQADFEDKADASEEEIQKYFEENKSLYKSQPQAQIRYIVQPMADLTANQEATAEEIKEYYDENLQRYKHGEEAKARHILLKVTPGISEQDEEPIKNRLIEIRKEIEGGLAFEEAAEKYSEGPSATRGGDLGYFGRGRMLPPFEKAAFELPLGQVSEPVKTQFGYHLILVEDRKEEGTDTLESVRDEIAKSISQQKAMDAFRAEMEQIQSLDAIADRYEIKTADWFSRGDDIPGLTPGERSVVVSAAFRNDPDSSIAVAGYPNMDNVFVIERLGRRESRPQTLEEARDKVIAAVKKAKSGDLAKAAAQAGIDKIRSASLTLEAIAAESGMPLETSDFFTREDQSIRGFGYRPTELVSTAFTLTEGELGGPVKTSMGYHLIRLIARDPEHIPELDDVRQQVEQDCLRDNAEQIAKLEARKFSDIIFNQQAALETIGAASEDIEWGTTELFTVRDPLPEIGQQPSLNYAAFQIDAVGDVSDRAVPVMSRANPMDPNQKQSTEAFYVLQLKEIKETYLPELSEVEEDAEKDYRLLLAEKVAEQHANEALEQIRQGLASAQPLTATKAIELKDFEDADNTKETAKGGLYRGPYEISGSGMVSGISGRPWPFVKTALTLEPGQVSGIIKCYRDKRTKDGESIQGPMLGVYILQVLGKKAPEAEGAEDTPAQQQLERRFQSVAYEAWIDEVSSTARIEYNRKVLFPDEYDESMKEENGEEEQAESSAS